MSLDLSKCHIVGNHMSWLIYLFPTAIITVMCSVKIKVSASVDSAPASSFTLASTANVTPANVFL